MAGLSSEDKTKMEQEEKTYHWFLFYKDRLLLRKTAGRYEIPYGDEAPLAIDHALRVVFPDGSEDRAASLDSEVLPGEDFEFVGLRTSWDYISHSWYKKAGKAFQLVHWDRHSRFCPACGRPTRQNSLISKYCDYCHEEYYPQISTAIIVLIRRGDEILLVHARNFRGTFHGLVAGFLEVGETLEECVRREVREETGLEIRNIRYFDSQPWPYPSGLMVGFTADYESGSIKLQDEELSAGAFYGLDNLPELPQKLSIARRLIDAWIREKKNTL